jgi:valacyclovir hydrolase
MTWFEHGGSRIYYEVAGHGDPVLLLPGWSESNEELQLLRDPLESRYRVIAAELPGSGRSEPQPRQYAVTFYQDDARSLLALLDHLRATPARVVGFSDGGEVALCMAEFEPRAVRAVVAWGAAGSMQVEQELLEAFYNLIDDPIEPLREFSEQLRQAYGESNAREMSRNFVNALRQIAETGGDISRARAGEIACPALLITGEHDFFAPPTIVSGLVAAIPSGEFMEAKGAGHDVHRSHAEWFQSTVVGWLSAH